MVGRGCGQIEDTVPGVTEEKRQDIRQSSWVVPEYKSEFEPTSSALVLLHSEFQVVQINYNSVVYMASSRTAVWLWMDARVWYLRNASCWYGQFYSHIHITRTVLGAFANLRKATVSLVMAVCPHATTRLPMDGFLWNLIFNTSSKICRENSNFIKIRQKYFTWRFDIFNDISLNSS